MADDELAARLARLRTSTAGSQLPTAPPEEEQQPSPAPEQPDPPTRVVHRPARPLQFSFSAEDDQLAAIQVAARLQMARHLTRWALKAVLAEANLVIDQAREIDPELVDRLFQEAREDIAARHAKRRRR